MRAFGLDMFMNRMAAFWNAADYYEAGENQRLVKRIKSTQKSESVKIEEK